MPEGTAHVAKIYMTNMLRITEKYKKTIGVLKRGLIHSMIHHELHTTILKSEDDMLYVSY